MHSCIDIYYFVYNFNSAGHPWEGAREQQDKLRQDHGAVPDLQVHGAAGGRGHRQERRGLPLNQGRTSFL